MMKKMIVLMALATAASALSAPGVASGQWTKHTKAITAVENIAVTGLFKTTGEIGGVDCHESHATMTTSGGTAASVTSFGATNVETKCTPTGGLAFCTVKSVEATGLPWPAHTNTATITITNVKIDTTYSGAFCPYHATTKKGTLIATPDNRHHTTTLTFSGVMEVYNQTNTAFVTTIVAGGQMSFIPAGTYGIT